MNYERHKGDGQIELYQADALVALEELAQERPESFDLIITDPPYWTLDKWRNIGTTTRLGGNRDKTKQRQDMWFDTLNAHQILRTLIAMERLLKPNSHFYVFCDDETSDYLKQWLKEGWLHFDYAKRLVWDKVDAGMGYHWRATYEFIMFFEKGKRRLNDLGKRDVFHVKRVQGKHYPTEKPLPLVEELLLNSSNAGDLVLDPFSGSGVLGAAAQLHNRRAVLIDNSPAAFDWAANRLWPEVQAAAQLALEGVLA